MGASRRPLFSHYCWVKKVDHTGSVSSTPAQSIKAGLMSVSEVPQSPPVPPKIKETLRRDQHESWEENSAN